MVVLVAAELGGYKREYVPPDHELLADRTITDAVSSVEGLSARTSPPVYFIPPAF